MDLYTIIAQIFNFLILLLILNKFLYKPLLSVIEKRKEDLCKKIDETDKNLNESQNLKKEYENKIIQLEINKNNEKEKIKKELNDYKKKEIIEIQKEIELEKKKMIDFINSEKKNLIENFNSHFIDLFIEYSNSILSVLSNENLQKQIIYKFFEKITLLSNEKIEEINRILSSKIMYIYSNDEILDKNKNNIIIDYICYFYIVW